MLPYSFLFTSLYHFKRNGDRICAGRPPQHTGPPRVGSALTKCSHHLFLLHISLMIHFSPSFLPRRRTTDCLRDCVGLYTACLWLFRTDLDPASTAPRLPRLVPVHTQGRFLTRHLCTHVYHITCARASHDAVLGCKSPVLERNLRQTLGNNLTILQPQSEFRIRQLLTLTSRILVGFCTCSPTVDLSSEIAKRNC